MNKPVKLYSFVPFDRGSRVRWLAGELGLSCAERPLAYTSGEHRQDWYRALSPFGRVPAAEVEGRCLFESGAICQYLVEQYPERAAALAPAPGTPERGAYLSWMFFAASDYDANIFPIFNFSFLRRDEARRAEAIEAARTMLGHLEQHMASRDYVLGAQFSVPDVLLGHGLVLLTVSKVIADYPNLVRYRDRLAARPAAAHLFAMLKAA